MTTDWKPFDYDNKAATAPESDKLVWIHEEWYHGVTLGFFDGFTFNTYWGSDDCHITHWATLIYPAAPAAPSGSESAE